MTRKNSTPAASIGLSTLEPSLFESVDFPHPIPAAYFENMGLLMIKNADQALYESKKNGGDQLHSSLPLKWPPFVLSSQ
jgi:GGDEF domain-containing protein